jgi:leucine dehydrogenase
MDLRCSKGAQVLGVFEAIGSDSHEEVLFGSDSATGLRTIVAIHDTTLGPALGGTRFYPYENEAAALRDVLRLSKGMTYKSSAAGLSLGGGKAVVIGDPATLKTEELLRAYAGIVDSLGGRYITAEDVGTTATDMVTIREGTKWVSGLPSDHDGSGDPSPWTSRGVVAAMRALAQRLWGSADLTGRRIAVQGVGKVGGGVVELLMQGNADIIIADVDDAKTERYARTHGCKPVELEDIYGVDCDFFSPCALGASLSAATIPLLRCSAIAGSANNQLATKEDAYRLAEREILYAPDFVVNAGGIINIAVELEGYSEERAASLVDGIADSLMDVLDAAESLGLTPHEAATRLAEDRLENAGSRRLVRDARQS